MSEELLAKIREELHPQYGTEIKQMFSYEGKEGNLEVDVLATLEAPEDRRELGAVLQRLGSQYDIGFHQYVEADYRPREKYIAVNDPPNMGPL